MTEPITPNIGLIVPNTGDLPGAWGTAAVNVNMSALDGMFGGFVQLSFSVATTVALSLPSSGSLTPGSGPVQSQNACIGLSGTLSGNAVIQIGMPGRYVFDNRCLGTANYVQLAPASGPGNVCGVPPGKKTTFFFDGTNVDFVDLPPQLGGIETINLNINANTATRMPAWITACTVPPFLPVNGGHFPGGTTIFNSSLYPALFNLLGTTSLPQMNPYNIVDTNAGGVLCLIRAA